MREYKNRIVVLATSFTVCDKQATEQTKAIQLFEDLRIPFQVVDGFDPCMMKRRDQLFRISQLPGEYPQFFVEDNDDENPSKNTSYIGDWQRIQDIHEDSNLPESIIGAHPLITTWERLLNAGYRNKLLLIISTLNIDPKQTLKQERAMALLKAKRIPFDALNAADPESKERRNELFDVSGIRGEYPQFFLIEKSGETHYIGDFETVVAINDLSGLPKSEIETDPGAITWDRLLNAGLAT